jgi:hypothetical protein
LRNGLASVDLHTDPFPSAGVLQTRRVTPAMEARVSNHVCNVEEIVRRGEKISKACRVVAGFRMRKDAPTTAPTSPATCRDFLSISATSGDGAASRGWRLHQKLARRSSSVQNVQVLLDLIFGDSQLNVYGSELEVRPPRAPSTGCEIAGRSAYLSARTRS